MRHKVIIAEDDNDIAEALRDRLEACGFAVVTVSNGLEVLRTLIREPFDGIFLDVKMPEMDGMTTLREIRKTWKAIPIIMITASSTKETRTAAITAGADEYILKPFHWGELKAKIERVFHLTLS